MNLTKTTAYIHTTQINFVLLQYVTLGLLTYLFVQYSRCPEIDVEEIAVTISILTNLILYIIYKIGWTNENKTR